MMNLELKDCPCCGGEATYWEDYPNPEDIQETLVIGCSRCWLKMEGYYPIHGTEAQKESAYREMADEWNKRV